MAALTDDELASVLLTALVHPEPDDWATISAAAQSERPSWRRPRRALLLVAIAVLALTIAVASALGVAPNASIFNWGNSNGTSRVLVRTHTLDGRPLTLTGSGDASSFCYSINVGGKSGGSSCGPVRPGTVGTWGLSEISKPGSLAAEGYAMSGIAPPPTTAVRVTFRDRTSRVISLDNRAWLADMPPAVFTYGHDPVRIAALDGSGDVIVSRTITLVKPPVLPARRLSVVATVRGRPLLAGPSTTGSICVRLLRADGIGANSCPKSLNGTFSMNSETTAYAVRFGLPGKPGTIALIGPLAPGATARVTFQDGSYVNVQRHGDAFLLVRPGDDHNPPIRLDVRNDHGLTTRTSLRGPKAGLYRPAWHGGRYPLVTFGAFNSLNYQVGQIQWPDGHVTPP